MIKKLRVSNYRSLGQDVEIELGPLTVLVGQNGSGKSNVVDIFRFIADSLSVGLHEAVSKREGIRAVRRWSPDRPLDLSIGLTVSREGFNGEYDFTLAGDSPDDYRVGSERARIRLGEGTEATSYSFHIADGEWLDRPEGLYPLAAPNNLALTLLAGDQRFQPLAHYLRDIRIYSIFPNSLRKPQKHDPRAPMHEHGGNWLSILIDPKAKEWKDELLAALGALTGDIEDLEIISTGSYLIARFRHTDPRASKWFEAAQESDGTLRVAGILTALLQDETLPVIGIEEPELTVHPGALPLLRDFFRQAARNSQVVLTTHSPDLLDELDVDEVRVVERRQGETTVAPLEEDQRQLVRDRLLTLSEVMRMEGFKQQQPVPTTVPE